MTTFTTRRLAQIFSIQHFQTYIALACALTLAIATVIAKHPAEPSGGRRRRYRFWFYLCLDRDGGPFDHHAHLWCVLNARFLCPRRVVVIAPITAITLAVYAFHEIRSLLVENRASRRRVAFSRPAFGRENTSVRQSATHSLRHTYTTGAMVKGVYTTRMNARNTLHVQFILSLCRARYRTQRIRV